MPLTKSVRAPVTRTRHRIHRTPRTADGAARGGVLLALVLCASALAALARGDADSRHLTPVAIPPASTVKPHWHDERAAFAAKLVRGYRLRQELAEEFAGWILEASARHGLAAELIASLVVTESSFRKHVRSVTGATGPAQVRADLWGAFCGGFLDDPEQNLYCGAQVLAHYRGICGLEAASHQEAEACALRSYNLGFGNRDNVYFLAAGDRYEAKIDRFRQLLAEVS